MSGVRHPAPAVSGRADTSLVGLAIVVPTPCPRCNGTAATLGAGRGPHKAIMCTCGRHGGWVSQASYNFIAETVRLFGRPTEPIRIRAPARTAAALGAVAASQASAPRN